MRHGRTKFLHALGIATPILFAVLAAAALHATGTDDDTLGFSFETPAAEVRTLTLHTEDLPLSLTIYGEVHAAQENMFRAEVTGRIVTLAPNLESGTFVTKGSLLLEIEDSLYREALMQARQSLAQAKLALAEEEARSAQARASMQRVNQKDRTPLALRQPQQQLAHARVVAAQASVRVAEENLSRTKLYAPYEGYIVERSINIGDYVTQGDLMLSLYQRGELLVRSALSKTQFSQLLAMQRASALTAPSKHGEAPSNTNTHPNPNSNSNSNSNLSLSTLNLGVFDINVMDAWADQQHLYPVSDLIISAAIDPANRKIPVTARVKQTHLPSNLGDTPTQMIPTLKPGSFVTLNFSVGRLPDVIRLSNRIAARFVSQTPDRLSSLIGVQDQIHLALTFQTPDGHFITQHLPVFYQSETDSFIRLPEKLSGSTLVINPDVIEPHRTTQEHVMRLYSALSPRQDSLNEETADVF